MTSPEQRLLGWLQADRQSIDASTGRPSFQHVLILHLVNFLTIQDTMHFLTILTLGTSVTAAVAGGRKPTRPIWNQQGPVKAGHDLDSAAEFAERTQTFAHEVRDGGKPHTPIKPDDEEDEPIVKTSYSKGNSGLLKGAWNKVNHKAREAVELAKAQAAKRDVDDEAEAMHNTQARGQAAANVDSVRARNWNSPPRPAMERLVQRDVDDEDDDEFEDEDDFLYDIRDRDAQDRSGQHGDATRVINWHAPPRPASERLGQRDVDVEEGDMSDYDQYLASRDLEDFDEEDDEDYDKDDEDGEDHLFARDIDDTNDVDDVDDIVDFDHDEDDLIAHTPASEEEAPSPEDDEDTQDDAADLTARNADPEPRRLFHFGKHVSKVVSLVYARGTEEEDDDDYEEADLAERDFLDGTMPAGSIETASGAPAAPPPQLAHETNGWGKQHGHNHYHHAEPEMQAGPARTRTQNQNWFLQ